MIQRWILWLFDRFIIVDNRMGLESLGNSLLRAAILFASLLAAVCVLAVAVGWLLW